MDDRNKTQESRFTCLFGTSVLGRGECPALLVDMVELYEESNRG